MLTIHTMKHTSHRVLLLSLVPLLAPIAMGDVHEKRDQNNRQAAAAAEPSWRASDIIGTDVKTTNDDTIGEIQDLVIDFKSGEILGVVVSTGGFLGLGETLSTVPSSKLRYDKQAEAFKTKLTKEQLEKAPRHTKESWNEDRSAVQGQLRTYQDSVGTEDENLEADNTGRNDRDRNEEKMTPVDQGNNDTDLQSTQDIRSALMDTDLSFNAKNVKIITKDKQVTLRGVVDSPEEHKKVVELARKHAGEGNVNDEIEVKKD